MEHTENQLIFDFLNKILYFVLEQRLSSFLRFFYAVLYWTVDA